LPRIYLSPTELNSLPIGLGLAGSISQLSSGVLDKMLANASQRADNIANKRLQSPGTSTLTQTANANTSVATVASTLTLDELSEQAVIINPNGANQEIVGIVNGGVTISSWNSPYPGTIALTSPLVNSHNSGETVQYCYKEVTQAGSSSSSDPYTEALQTQAMQLALAHLPPARTALTRIVFLKSYPITNIYLIEHAFSFVNQFNVIDGTIESRVDAEGWYRFNVGTVVLREGLMRTTYTGGYQVIPDDIKTAVSFLFAEQMMLMINPYMMEGLTMGKRSYRWGNQKGKLMVVQEAEDILKKYKRLI
jgi:hypothetical protein